VVPEFYLLQLWKAGDFTDAVQQVKAPELIYLESSPRDTATGTISI